jgi:DtxR family transcriptional regulator, Mn-dependent transcriptional regulator
MAKTQAARGLAVHGLTDAAQDYLKEIYKLQVQRVRPTTTAIADRMRVTAPSVTAMVKKLASLGLVEHERYRGVVLTEAGEKIAIEVVRHHRLLELYLAESLGLGIDAVHAEADRLEHALSEELEARIDKALGYPTHDPHGDPIPDAKLRLKSTKLRTLADLEPGERSTIQRVPDGSVELLRYLATLELLPGEPVELRRSAPFGGPLAVGVRGTEHAISRELADQISVA